MCAGIVEALCYAARHFDQAVGFVEHTAGGLMYFVEFEVCVVVEMIIFLDFEGRDEIVYEQVLQGFAELGRLVRKDVPFGGLFVADTMNGNGGY